MVSTSTAFLNFDTYHTFIIHKKVNRKYYSVIFALLTNDVLCPLRVALSCYSYQSSLNSKALSNPDSSPIIKLLKNNTHQQCILHDIECGDEYEKGKHKRANRIDNNPLGLEVDHECSQKYTTRLNKIADNVNECSTDVHILMYMLVWMRGLNQGIFSVVRVLFGWCRVTVTVSVVMKRTAHSVVERGEKNSTWEEKWIKDGKRITPGSLHFNFEWD